jgi:CBS-domain-containing membrane protein
LVRELMTRAVVTVGPDAPVAVVARVLAGRGFTAAPVVDECGELVGIVTDGGRVTLRDNVADPAEEHPASVVAAAVRGVVQVQVLPPRA